MELLVNGVQVQMDELMPKEVDALIETVVRRSQSPPGSVVSEILADGQELVMNLAQSTQPVTVDSFNKLEIKIEPAEKLLQRMLEDGLQFCIVTSENSQKAGLLFRELKMEQANTQFASLLGQFSVFVQFIDGLRDFLKTLCNHSEMKDDIAPVFDRLSDTLTKCGQAQTSQDWNLLADLLEYEVTDILTEFIDSFDKQWGTYQSIQEIKGLS